MKSFLVIPARGQGRGGGHLFRSATLVKALRAGGAEAWLFEEKPAAADFMRDSLTIPEDFWIDEREITQKKWTLIILDRFRTEQDELQRWAALAPVLGIDEGLSRNECDFLIDLLPALPPKSTGKKANLCAPSLLTLPKNRRVSFDNETARSHNILVSFGAEDPGGYTVSTALVLQKKAGGESSLTAVLGPLRKNNAADRGVLEQAGVTVIEGDNLREKLADYDLIVTHFGITAFEALYARVPVLLVNPTPYHEQLSVYAGLATVGFGQEILEFTRKSFSTLHKICVEKSGKAAPRWGLDSEQRENLGDLLLRTQPAVHRRCPLCGTAAGKIAGRFPGRTYRYCSCGALIMDRLLTPPMEYNRDYFFADYQKQYGKTYLEDFPQLKKMGERRLGEMSTLLDIKRGSFNTPSQSCKRLLDIGCAYGPFLAAARDSGFKAVGVDPAADAVAYVRNTLGINAVQGSFPEAVPELTAIAGTEQAGGTFDGVTLWYVLEHFEDPGKILRAVNGLLKTGGVLAFSTPSAAGISRRKSLRAFLEKSPADHWSIWDPRRTAAILRHYGFRLKKIVVTGHHPERFPHALAALRFLGLPQMISRIFALGDTFEAYAVKVKNGEKENHG